MHELRDSDELDSHVAAEFKHQFHQPRPWRVDPQNGWPARIAGIQQIRHIGLVESHVPNREASKTSERVGVRAEEPAGPVAPSPR